MSAVHDHATVLSRDGWLHPNTEIEVVGFAYRGNVLMAIWRDEQGMVHDTPAAGIRLEPHVENRTETFAA